MSEEVKPEPKSVPKFICVCAKCFQHASDNAMMEFNFRDIAIYFVCPGCRHQNKMSMKPISAQPLPRARLSH